MEKEVVEVREWMGMERECVSACEMRMGRVFRGLNRWEGGWSGGVCGSGVQRGSLLLESVLLIEWRDSSVSEVARGSA